MSAIVINVGTKFNNTACPQRPFKLSFACCYSSFEDSMSFTPFYLCHKYNKEETIWLSLSFICYYNFFKK